MSDARDAVIIGAGPGGLAAAAALRSAGLAPLVIDRAAAVGASWRAHYERLHLHTERALSGLPGFAIPREFGRWVSRAHVVEYLERYARHHQLELQLGTEVQKLERENGLWRVDTGAGPITARAAVVATGYNHTPRLPEWPGQGSFTGQLLHSATYKNAGPFSGRDVLVVGTGNSGAEIAVDLVEGGASRVRVSVRTPPNIAPRELLGMSTQRLGVLLRYLPPGLVDGVAGAITRLAVGDLRPFGLPSSPRGAYTRAREGQIPILDVGFVAALKARKVTIVPAVRAFEGKEVVLEGGERVEPEVVIAATGYSRALERLVGHLGVLDEKGMPLAHGARTLPAAPRLHFIGYSNPISGNFREMAIDARRIASALRTEKARGEWASA